MSGKSYLVFATSLLALSQAGIAWGAQADTAHPASPAADAVAERGGGDIVVTANKREQSISKVGMAITAFTGETLANQRVTSLADLATAVPGLSFSPAKGDTPVYTLRGVGFYENSLANYPSVATYVDEVSLPFPVMTKHTTFDLERVELLKGPQGTLFGESSTGGAINFIAAKPTDHFVAGGDLGYGNFNRVEGNVYIGGPLADTLKVRLALNGARADPWQRSYTRQDKIGKTEYFAGRFIADWRPSDLVKFELNLNGWRDNSDPQAPQVQAVVPNNFPTGIPGQLNYPLSPNNPYAADWGPGADRPFSHQHLLQASLRSDWYVSDDVTLTSITAYSYFRQRRRVDRDGMTYSVSDEPSNNGVIKNISQEIRLANAANSDLRWLIGLNYGHAIVNQNGLEIFRDSSNTPLFGYTGDFVIANQTLNNYAGFVNLEYDAGSRFTLKAGARFTQANRTSYNCEADPGDGLLTAAFLSASSYLTGNPTEPHPSGCLALDDVTEDGTPATQLPTDYHGKLHEHNVSWHAGVDFKPSSNLLIYGNVSKGYKAGSIPFVGAATVSEYLPVVQESLLAFEGGYKLQALDRRLSITGAAFYYRYHNKQELSRVPTPLFGALTALKNIPKSHVIGLEMDATLRPVDGLSIFGSGTFLKTKVDRFTEGYSDSQNPVDLSGSRLPFTPKFQFTGGFDYKWDMGSVRPFFGLTVSSRTGTSANIGGQKGYVPPVGTRSSVPIADTYKIKGYTLLDLRAGVEAGQFKITAFAKNVTNKFYVTNVYFDYEIYDRFTGMPRTYGISVGYQM